MPLFSLLHLNRLPTSPLFVTTIGILAILAAQLQAFANSEVTLQKIDQKDALIYVVKMPKTNRNVVLFPWVSSSLQPVDKVAEGLKTSKFIEPIAVINAGFFDPKSRATISYVVKNGEIIADPSQNQGLMGNTNIQPFLNQVLNRSMFAQLVCRGGVSRYKVQKQFDPVQKDCFVNNAIQAGPNLYTTSALKDEAFIAHDANGKLTRDPIGYRWKNARSAIGVTSQGDVLLVMVSMKNRGLDASNEDDDNKSAPTGLNVAEMGAMMKQLGASEALALDGGSSSSLWFNGQSFFGKLDKLGKPIRRSVKSVWVLGQKKKSP